MNGINVNETLEELFYRQEEKVVHSKLMLHYWYICEVEDNGRKWICAKGNVSGHDRLMDTSSITTSKIRDIVVNELKGEVIIHTQNNVYYCPLEYCDFNKQREFPNLLENFEKLEREYSGKVKVPMINEDEVLVVLSDFDPYYCNSMYYYVEGTKELKKVKGVPHVGTFQDSYLIWSEDRKIDIRFFPDLRSIELYMVQTNNRKLLFENIGGTTVSINMPSGMISLQPGERKEIKVKRTFR